MKIPQNWNFTVNSGKLFLLFYTFQYFLRNMASIGVIGGINFLSHVLKVRSEIRDRFSRVHKMLQDRETDLLATLQELEEEYTGDVITIQIRQLNLSKDGLVSTLT